MAGGTPGAKGVGLGLEAREAGEWARSRYVDGPREKSLLAVLLRRERGGERQLGTMLSGRPGWWKMGQGRGKLN
jgi:hypothetical protein